MNDNIYLELELSLDPPVTDAVLLERDIMQRISGWNKKENSNPRFKSMREKANQYMQAGLRCLNLSVDADAAKSKRTAELHEAIREVYRDFVITQEEFNALVQAFPCFTKETIEKKLPAKVARGASGSGFQPPPKPDSLSGEKEVPQHEMDWMAERFRLIKGEPESLYELLLHVPTTSPETLLKATKEAAEKNRRKPTKTAEVTAIGELLGKALVHFKDSNAKAAYDRALRRRPFDELCHNKFRWRAFNKSVTIGDYQDSIKETRERNFSQAEAEWLVYDYYCNLKKCVPPTQEVKADPVIQCSACYRLNDPAAIVCKDCGSPIKLTCPNCKKENNLSAVKYCSCGFAVGDMANAVLLLKAARNAFEKDNIEEAKALIRRARVYWPDYPDATDLRTKIDERERNIAATKGKVTEIENEIRKLRGRNELFEAEKHIGELKSIRPSSETQNDDVRYVVETLGQIRNDLKQIPTIREIEDRIALCEEILAKAADCIEAREALLEARKRLPPPPPPESLSVKEVHGAFQLRWKSPDVKRPVRFLVVRKRNGKPASPNDGERLIELSNTEYTDSQIEIGAIYGYAVFSKRNDQAESKGDGFYPVQKYGEVQNLKATPGDRSVALSWDRLSRACKMIVTRHTGKQLAEIGVPLRIPDGSSLIDSGLENGKVYTYRVQAVFITPEGKEYATDGKTISCQPSVPPDPVLDLRLSELQDSKVRLDWTTPSHATIYLYAIKYLSGKEHGIPKPGKSLFTTPHELSKRFGEPLAVTTPGTHLWEPDEDGVRIVLPISFRDGIAVFGQSVLHIRLPEVASFRMQSTGLRLHLSWKWPEGVEKVLLLYRHDQLPKNLDDSHATRLEVNDKEYMKNHSVDFPVAGGQDYYFRVYTVFDRKGKSIYSKGIRAQTAQTVIRYELLFRKSGTGETQAVLSMRAEDQAASLPAFIIRKGEGQRPLNRDRGQLIAEISAVEASKRSVVIPGKHFEENCYIRLFVKDPNESPLYLIYDPPQKKLELYPR